MDMLDFYIPVVKALDEISAPYMIVGAYGGSVFGIATPTGAETLEMTNKTLARARDEIEKEDSPRKW